jgi:hypothetical protein
MIAPEPSAGKPCLRGKRVRNASAEKRKRRTLEPKDSAGVCGASDRRDHGFVKGIIMKPYFGPARAKLD